MFLQKFAGLLAGFLYKTYASTFRYHLHFEDESDRSAFFTDLSYRENRKGKNLIYACFHQDDLSLLPYFADKNICILISNSKDGQMLASAVEHMGYETVRGSSHRGGAAGLLAGMKRVIAGQKMTIAVDGPRGPIYKVKEGITAMSEKAKCPIVPVRAKVSRKFVFKKSWNKATLPFPLARVDIHLGKIKFYTTEELETKMKAL